MSENTCSSTQEPGKHTTAKRVTLCHASGDAGWVREWSNESSVYFCPSAHRHHHSSQASSNSLSLIFHLSFFKSKSLLPWCSCPPTSAACCPARTRPWRCWRRGSRWSCATARVLSTSPRSTQTSSSTPAMRYAHTAAPGEAVHWDTMWGHVVGNRMMVVSACVGVFGTTPFVYVHRQKFVFPLDEHAAICGLEVREKTKTCHREGG